MAFPTKVVYNHPWVLVTKFILDGRANALSFSKRSMRQAFYSQTTNRLFESGPQIGESEVGLEGEGRRFFSGSSDSLSLDSSSKAQLSGKGVFHENEQEDINVMVHNFPAPALARALRERENALQQLAKLLLANNDPSQQQHTGIYHTHHNTLIAEQLNMHQSYGSEGNSSHTYDDINNMKLEIGGMDGTHHGGAQSMGHAIAINTKVTEILRPYSPENIENRRVGQKFEMARLHSSTSGGKFTKRELLLLQKFLKSMPKYVDSTKPPPTKRASVLIPLCNVNGKASILFEKRSEKVRTHKQQVCFPGGMVDEDVDESIIQTSLREMEEELGIPTSATSVLGILRCNWDEVANMTGIAVTPVVGFIGELTDLKLKLNFDEVQDVMSVPLADLLEERHWVIRDFAAPMFTGAPNVIWGLTGYLLDKFLKDAVMKCNKQKEIV